MVSPAPATPSDEVDQVWHLHLVHTRSYWEDLQAILGRPLHHGPTAGGREEDQKFEDWYERTKALYEGEFGEKPPADLWPPAEARFHPRQRFRRLDTAAHWIIAKPDRQWRGRAAAFAALPLALPLLAASGGFPVALFVIILCVALVLIIEGTRRRRGRGPSGGDGNGWSSFFSGCGSGGDDCGGSGDCGGGCGGGGCEGE